MAVVERDPNIRSFFQFTQKLSSPLGPGKSFGLSETDLYPERVFAGEF